VGKGKRADIYIEVSKRRVIFCIGTNISFLKA
jgi:hypothetical protein